MNATALESKEVENIAATLARELPKPQELAAESPHARADIVRHFALPKNFALHSINSEHLQANPLRTKAAVTLNDADSFIAYVTKHRGVGTVVWCGFDPQRFSLSFKAIVNDHHPEAAGWRDHSASYTPAMSSEWKVWTDNQKQPKDQVSFAEFIEAHERDIASADGLPTSLQMHEMASNFVARQDQLLKSAVRTQSGGVNLTYICDPDTNTTETMRLFERFAIGIPVFWAGPGYQILARLKYRMGSGKVSFFYELIRADIVHQAAAQELISKVRAGIGDVPLLMGASG